MDMLWYGHKHGFVAEAVDLLWNECASGTPARKAAAVDARLETAFGVAREEDAAREAAGVRRGRREALPRFGAPGPTPECVAAASVPPRHLRRVLAGVASRVVNDLSLYGLRGRPRRRPRDAGLDMSTWMARADVRAALHVEDAPADVWPSRTTTGATSPSGGRATTLGTPSMVDFTGT